MKFLRFVLSRSSRCPHCGSSNMRRSHTKGLEYVLGWIFQLHPYRCLDCSERHFRFRSSHSHAVPHHSS